MPVKSPITGFSMQYDFIFAGGGMSALLVAHLIKSEKALVDCTMLIIDPNVASPQSKNICFWADRLPALPLTLKGKWDSLSFAGEKGTKIRRIDPLSYYCFDAASLLTQLKNNLLAAGGVTFVEDKVARMDETRVEIKGGMAKPTTGYTFLNSYRQAQKIVAQLLAGRRLDSQPTPNKRFAFYDRLLMNIIRTNPEAVKPIMESLFYHNRYGTLLAFLSERSTLFQEAGLFWSLPWKPFLTALYHEFSGSLVRDEAQSRADRPILHFACLKNEWLVE